MVHFNWNQLSYADRSACLYAPFYWPIIYFFIFGFFIHGKENGKLWVPIITSAVIVLAIGLVIFCIWLLIKELSLELKGEGSLLGENKPTQQNMPDRGWKMPNASVINTQTVSKGNCKTESKTESKSCILLPGHLGDYYITTISDGKCSVEGYGDTPESSQEHASNEWRKKK